MQGDSVKNYIHLHIIVFIWGFTAVLGKLITIGAFSLVWYRMNIALVLMLIYALATKTPFKVSGRVFMQFAIAGLIIALHWFMIYFSPATRTERRRARKPFPTFKPRG